MRRAGSATITFADESLDGVVASNLLVHVAVLANVNREVRQVCRLGSQIYVDFTSVHPYHGFPHHGLPRHYFNATESGRQARSPSYQPKSVPRSS